jgi:pyruvate ferredoxin oxidoreductase alpha subunit
MGSMCGTLKQWMLEPKDTGLIKIRTYRPFPTEQLRKIVENNGIEKIIVLEKNDAPGAPVPQVTQSIMPALYPLGTVIHSFIVGLGGRDVTYDEFNAALKKMKTINNMKGDLYTYLGVRERRGVIENI